MTSRRFAKTSAVLLVALGCWSPVSGEEITIRFTAGLSNNRVQTERIIRWDFNSGNLNEFIDYMNKMDWSDGTKRIFSNPRNCRINKDLNTHGFADEAMFGSIRCNADMQEDSVLGRRVCANISMRYEPYRGPYEVLDYDGSSEQRQGSNAQYNISNLNDEKCSPWKEVAIEPPKEKTPELDQSTQPTQSVQPARPAGFSTNDYKMFGGGIVVFILGVATGILSKRNY